MISQVSLINHKLEVITDAYVYNIPEKYLQYLVSIGTL